MPEPTLAFSKMCKAELVVWCQKLTDTRTTLEEQLREEIDRADEFRGHRDQLQKDYFDLSRQINELTETNAKLAQQVEILIGVIGDMKGGK